VGRDVDLPAGRIAVGRARTSASYREVDVLPVLRDALVAWRMAAPRTGADDLVFPTARGRRRDKDNLCARVVAPIVRRADVLLEREGLQPMPQGVTSHRLRRTFTSVLFALGREAPYVMRQLGHTDPRFTLRVYAHVMSRGDEERERLRTLVEGRATVPEEADAGVLATVA
jgi:integrase